MHINMLFLGRYLNAWKFVTYSAPPQTNKLEFAIFHPPLPPTKHINLLTMADDDDKYIPKDKDPFMKALQDPGTVNDNDKAKLIALLYD